MLVKIEVHSDPLCPWCFIQKRSLDNAMRRYQDRFADVEFEVLWRPYYVYPLLTSSCEKETLYEKAVGADKLASWKSKIQTAGSKQNITFNLSGRTGPSRPAHTLLSLALQQRGSSTQANILEILFQGHFLEGQDISDQDWLVKVAKKEGLEEEDVRRALGSVDAAQEVDEEVRSARVERGVEAVPCVTMQGRYRVGGYQEEKVFEDLFDKIRKEESS